MKFSLPQELKEFELIASIQILQAIARTREPLELLVSNPSHIEWLQLAGLDSRLSTDASPEYPSFAFDQAHRQVDNSKDNYSQLLSHLSGYNGLPLKPPLFSDVQHAERPEGIVLAYHSEIKDCQIILDVWRLVAKFLRTYPEPLKVIAPTGQRIDMAGLTEAALLTDCSPRQKLEAVANCRLLIGVPNVYSWAAAAWERPLIVLIPEDIPQSRWYPQLTENQPFRALIYPKNSLEPAAVLVGIRHLIKGL